MISTATKSLLLGGVLTSKMKYSDNGYVILGGECPACGEEHLNIHAHFGLDNEYVVICPETNIEIYGIYA